MSITIKQQLENKKKPLGLSGDRLPKSIEITPGCPAKFYLDGDLKVSSSCLHCPDQPCIKYSEADNQDEISSKFRVDASIDTCAVDAIHWDYDSSTPIIDSERCILCGVCASRCPAQAIYLTSDGAKVSVPESLPALFSSEEDGNVMSHSKTRVMLNSLVIKGERLRETELIAHTVIKKIREFKGKVAGLVPNLLVRNIFRSFNIAAISYGQGVQYNTVDVLCLSENIYGVVEVELSPAIIDTPRNLAAYIAILSARYGIARENLESLSVGLQLPNEREQYWMVIDDMQRVLHIEVRTITILALLILLWARKDFSFTERGLNLSETNGTSLRAFLEKKLGRSVDISLGWENQLEPSK